MHPVKIIQYDKINFRKRLMINQGQTNLRRGRVSIENHHYHITSTTRNRKAIFQQHTHARLLIKQLQLSDQKGITHTKSFCIMPDHFHWLFELKEGLLSQAVARVKSGFSRESTLKIWQDGFYDHAIRSDESLINVARYIVANPLRANLVNNIGDYPFWDSIWLAPI